MNQICTALSQLIKSAGDDFVNDLKGLTDDQLTSSPMGSARPAADFAYEVAYVNCRVATRLRGETPGPWPFESWVTAPDDKKNQAALIEEIESSIQEVTTALAALSDADLMQPIKMGEEESSLYKLASMCLIHTCYHDGQLNYIQSLHGDMEIHWA